MANISTAFSAQIDGNIGKQAFPNPYFERKDWLSLDGEWEFTITKNRSLPPFYPQTIRVPFSPETPLSGVGVHIGKDDYLHYRKKFTLPPEFLSLGAGKIHLMAVDQECDIYFNGAFVLHHEGGYIPAEIVVFLREKENVIEVVAHDDTDSPIYQRGKQSNNPGGIFYHPTSGIYGDVYLEAFPADGYILSLDIEPLYDEQKVIIRADFAGDISNAEASIFYNGKLIKSGPLTDHGFSSFALNYDFFPWSPDDPNLYSLVVKAGNDEVRSVFAFRSILAVDKGGIKYLTLNGKPLFLSALLDQGYYPESGLTPPSEEAFINDIAFAKKCGFNALRKHIKIEPLRFYYACDKIGMIVMQDIPNSGSPNSKFYFYLCPFLRLSVDDRANPKLGRGLKESRDRFEKDLRAEVLFLKMVPSILVWTLFNEGWGQFAAVRLTNFLFRLDDTRLVDSTSGWFDKGVGDFSSHHVYFRSPRLHNDRKRVLSLSEFGGYSLFVEGHTYSNKKFGYKKFSSKESLNKGIEKLYRKNILPLIEKEGLSVAVFTELSDVEDEINGLLTYDRKVEKIVASKMKETNELLYSAYKDKFASSSD